MNIKKETSELLKSQIGFYLQNRDFSEIEFSFGRSNRIPKNYFSHIDKGLFQDIIRRLNSYSEFKRQPDTETLDIGLSNKLKLDIRLSVSGRQNITSFCKQDDNVLDSLTYVYKSRIGDISKVDLFSDKLLDESSPYDYGIRSNLKKEILFDLDKVSNDDDCEKARQQFLNFIKGDKSNIYNLEKTFRYKKRISYMTADGYRYDLTIVKSCYDKNIFTVEGANLLNRPEQYETEIEITKEMNETDENNILKSMVKYAGIILQVQQNSLKITSINESQMIKDKYNSFLGSLYSDPLFKDRAKNTIKQINYQLIKNNIIKESDSLAIPEISTSYKDEWPGPKPVSLEMKNLQIGSKNNILNYFTVTDKADGDGNLLYIDDEGECYLIDNNNRCRKLDIICKSERNSLLNGEYISKNLKNILDYNFYVYDIYFRNGSPIHLHPLYYPENIMRFNKEYKVGELEKDCEYIKAAIKDEQIKIKLTSNKNVRRYPQLVRYNNGNIIDPSDIKETTELLSYPYQEGVDVIRLSAIFDKKPIPDLRGYTIKFIFDYTPTESDDLEEGEIDENDTIEDDHPFYNPYYQIDSIIGDGRYLKLTRPIEFPYTDNLKLSFKIVLINRLEQMNECVDNIVKSRNIDSMNIRVKKFYYPNINDDSSEANSIFSSSNVCWSVYQKQESPYRYDGLIYTPMFSPVGYNENENYFILKGKTWNENFKWKPEDENTIDFLINIDKKTTYKRKNIEIQRDKILEKISYEKDGSTRIDNYKKILLYVGGNVNSSNNACFPKYNKYYSKKRFNPVTPHIEYCNEANLILQKGNIFGEDDRNMIENDSIVEFYYDKNREGMFRWIPKRTRYDKTFQYRNGKTLQSLIFKQLKEGIVKKKNIELDDKMEALFSNIKIYDKKINPEHPNSSSWKFLYRLSKNKWIITNLSNLDQKNLSLDSSLHNNISLNGGWLRYDFDFVRGKVYGNTNISVDVIIKLFIIYNILTKQKDLESNRNVERLRDFLKRNFESVITNSELIPIKDMNYGNNENVANNVWKTINCPISIEMITTGNGILNQAQEEDVYYNNVLMVDRNKSSTIQLQRFHNFIKRNALLRPAAINNKEEITILDLGCGKGGDISKWKDIGAKCVVGFDKSFDNLENTQDGACARYNDMINVTCKTKSKCPYVFFLQGDCGEDLDYLYMNQKEGIPQEMYNQLWYNNDKDWKLQSFLSEKCGSGKNSLPDFSHIYPHFSTNKFNIISCQFALHYFFRNNQVFDNFIKNVTNNLNNQGLLIGCCFDGRVLGDLLFDKNELEGTLNNNIIWKITKKYTNDIINEQDTVLYFKDGAYKRAIVLNIVKEKYRIKLSDTSDEKTVSKKMIRSVTDKNRSLGKEIAVYMNSINKIHTEYLVDFQFFKERLSPYKIKPLTKNEVLELGIPEAYNTNLGTLSFKEIYESIEKDGKCWNKNINNDPISLHHIKKTINKMSEAEKSISFLNSLFIYKREAES